MQGDKMETNYYNRSNNFSAPIRREPKPYIPKNISPNEETVKKETPSQRIESPQENGNLGLFKNLNSDDLLILGLIFLFLSDSSNDTLMLLALGYLLLCSHTKKQTSFT